MTHRVTVQHYDALRLWRLKASGTSEGELEGRADEHLLLEQDFEKADHRHRMRHLGDEADVVPPKRLQGTTHPWEYPE